MVFYYADGRLCYRRRFCLSAWKMDLPEAHSFTLRSYFLNEKVKALSYEFDLHLEIDPSDL